MKKLIIGCAIAALFATPALAADMAVKALPPAAPSAPSWTGFYAGLTFGYGWEDPTTTVTATGNDPNSTLVLTGFPGGEPVGPVSFRNKGAFGGIEAGYNWQAGRNYVAGIEADFNVSDIKGQGATTSVLNGNVLQQLSASQNILWFGTVRPRLGWLATDNLLLYGTGGVAYGRVYDTVNYGININNGVTNGVFSFVCPATSAIASTDNPIVLRSVGPAAPARSCGCPAPMPALRWSICSSISVRAAPSPLGPHLPLPAPRRAHFRRLFPGPSSARSASG